jgi:hypothetical protein
MHIETSLKGLRAHKEVVACSMFSTSIRACTELQVTNRCTIRSGRADASKAENPDWQVCLHVVSNLTPLRALRVLNGSSVSTLSMAPFRG